jgi:hypothetical protein
LFRIEVLRDVAQYAYLYSTSFPFKGTGKTIVISHP